MSTKRILVTGADGFIGSHLCEHLVTDGHAVRAFVYYNSIGTWGWLDTLPLDVQNELEVILGDVRDPFVVQSAVNGVDVVLHLAALIGIPYSYVAPQSYIDTNITGTLNVLEAVKTAGTERLVQTSTSEVYGSALFVPITEEHPLQGQSPYSASKIGADQLALSYYRSFGVPVTVMRPFNTYGPRQSARAVIPTIITQALAGAETINLGALSPTRDFNYVKDIARGFAMMGASDAGLGEVINFGSNFEISIGQVVDSVASAVGRPLAAVTEEERVRPEHSEVDRLWADATRAHEMIGWKPDYGGLDGFQRGIDETVAWFADAENLARYRTDRYIV